VKIVVVEFIRFDSICWLQF